MSITLPDSITDQMQFLVVEVCQQLDLFGQYLQNPGRDTGDALKARAGYSYNIERRIEHVCTEVLVEEDVDIDTQSIRAVEKIAYNLQDISEHAGKCVAQLNGLQQPLTNWEELASKVALIEKQVRLIPKLMRRQSPEAVLKSSERHAELLQIFDVQREQHLNALKDSAEPEQVIDGLFAAYEVQRMAEHLHMAYEAILSGIVKHPINFDQILAIKKGIKKISKQSSIEDINLETLAITKSGSTVSKLSRQSSKRRDQSLAVFKGGEKRKLREELDSLENWQLIYKGLVPQIYHFKKYANQASLLVEHLEGETFEQMLRRGDDKLIKKANKQLADVLTVVYHKTQSFDRKPARFMKQLLVRFDAICRVHPEWNRKQIRNLIEKAIEFEKSKIAQVPTVFIHGDFNLDNIIYNPEKDCVHFIDLRRSTYQDYVQDITVFIVSNYRLATDDKLVQRLLFEQIEFMTEFARSYADSIADKSFELRFALGLARSLITSTRFISDKKRSGEMFFKGSHLLQEVLTLDDKARKKYGVDINGIFCDE